METLLLVVWGYGSYDRCFNGYKIMSGFVKVYHASELNQNATMRGVEMKDKIRQLFCWHDWIQIKSHLISVQKFECVKCKKIGWWV